MSPNIADVTTVLLVEDDPAISEPLARAFGRESYEALTHGTGKGALEGIPAAGIIVLDLGLPDIDGLDVAHQVRAQGLTIPILMLTTRSEDSDLVIGLDAGADDYAIKPFRLAELLARVRAQVRRASGKATEDELSVGEIWADVAAHRVFVGSRELQLTTRESELLRVLVRVGGKVASGEDILEKVWGEDPTGSPQTLQMHVTWLHRKPGGDEERSAPPLAQEDGYLLTAGRVADREGSPRGALGSQGVSTN